MRGCRPDPPARPVPYTWLAGLGQFPWSIVRASEALPVLPSGGQLPVWGHWALISLLSFLSFQGLIRVRVPGEASPSGCGGGADVLGLS